MIIVGDKFPVTAEFTDANDAPVDPDSVVSLTLLEPDGTRTEYIYGTDTEVIRDSIGHYRFIITFDAAGRWSWRWYGADDTSAIAKEAFFDVEASHVLADA